ncbi:N-acetylmuramoyl-L-alanine amidase [Gracilibacillus massiliensis]|uniref:N-acetylmuramoyl-L-alanine amidase n=1 Tax=Gracilibacillus massiliensis TaxID=1564956 RepID=UPI001E3E07F5|nr:N-acetylmuramoyl-L-alanine amidase [Gracilibacillus massiliensis]
MKKVSFVTIVSIVLIFSMSLLIYAKEAQIEGENLNVRTGPGTEYDVVTQVNPPENYSILEESGDWAKIQITDEEGWIHKDYFSVIEEVTPTEPEELEQKEAISEQEDVTTEETQSDKTEEINQSGNLTGKRVVIDPGHGGRDVGAIGESNGYESRYTLRTANVMKEILENQGAEVFLTRTRDQYIPLTSRVSFANLHRADVFLSLHYNSTPEFPDVQGIDTFYYSDRDQQLAEYVHQGIISQTEANNRGIDQQDLQVLRTNHRPSLLLELGFISNQTEETHIQSRVYLEAISRGIARGLQAYFR